jgi:transcription-repair coupling factor (superfamily II helicase)
MFHVKRLNNYLHLLKSAELGESSITGAILPFVIASKAGESFSSLVCVPSTKIADALVNDLASIMDDLPIRFLGKTLIDGVDLGQSVAHLRSLAHGEPGLYVSTFSNLLSSFDAAGLLSRITLSVDEAYKMSWVEQQLSQLSFEKVDFVLEPQTYSIRGSIIDFFSGDSESPFRLDFFGDKLETITSFNPATQRSIENLNSVNLFSQNPYSSNSGKTIISGLPLETHLIVYSSLQPVIDEELFVNHIKQSAFKSHYLHLYERLNQKQNLLQVEQQPLYHRNLDSFKARVLYLNQNNYDVYLCADSGIQHNRLKKIFADLSYTPLILSLTSGFIDNTHKVAIFTDHQVFDRVRKRNIISRSFPSKPAINADDLEEGSFVVHLDFGIGVFLGVERIKVKKVPVEVLCIGYAHGDKVYVPVEKMDRVHKYEAGSEIKPKITKLRSTEWDQLKLKAKTSISKYAQELMELYAKRFVTNGHAYSPDSDLQSKMEAAFVFDETEDQLKAVAEIKKDMESSRPMDRLLCGDVGFGKTEVALRAAFKAVSDSKQVGVLVPTTILAEQHFETFSERFEGLPLTVGVVSRFKTKKDILNTLENVRKGKVDILIGTHRLLSKDVKFLNLGLLIIDEEHRFGVKNKEQILEFKNHLDCLSLTATPIPRTLQMSLIGARDYSLLSTPPGNRIPIKTSVNVYDDNLIKDAVMQEVGRGGQVYFIHNRVESIGIMHERLKVLLPGIKIQVGHGQMKPSDLERIMFGFFRHEYDMLLSTTIVESGLDNPNANTIIINRSDALGLSQLYQLRGRVGRSNKKAYAYLLTQPVRKLSENAIKRLNALERHSHYGGGYELAMRDLEIRGAGNIFGTEQSGSMTIVGYQLYSKILKETLEDLKAREDSSFPLFPKPDFKFDLPALIPQSFINSERDRVTFYRRVANAETVSAIFEIKAELRDRFGKLPQESKNLFYSTAITKLAQEKGIRSLAQKAGQSTGDFHPEYVEQVGPKLIKEISNAINSTGAKTQIMNNKTLTFLITHSQRSLALKELKIFLENMT